MTRIARSNVVTALVFLIALVCSWLVLARLAGADVDAGQMVPAPASVEPLDAGPYRTPGLVDTRVAADNPDPSSAAAAPAPDLTAAEPDAIKVPAPSADPGGLLGLAKDARKVGGLWLVGLILVFAAAAEVRKRTAPKDGEAPPDPRSWRARSYALACAAAVLTATLIDIKAGGIGWAALVAPGAFAIGRVMDAIDPPKGSKAKAGGVS